MMSRSIVLQCLQCRFFCYYVTVYIGMIDDRIDVCDVDRRKPGKSGK